VYAAARFNGEADLTEKYPDHKTYRALYARYYLGRPVEELLEFLKPLHDHRVLDICGGDGQLALGAIARGAREAVLVDQSSGMIPDELRKCGKILVHEVQIENFLMHAYLTGEFYERAVCRQGVNYWLNEDTARNLSLVLKPGAIFVFNTFHQKPAEKPRVLEYDLDGHMFVETSWSIGDVVHHIQVRGGMEPHYTSFHWLSPDRLQRILTPYFVVVEDRRGATSIYRCQRR
jgi:hypothetical protein